MSIHRELRRRWFFCVIFVLAMAATALGQATRPARHDDARRPVAGISHIVIISIDGLRPDLLLRADTPRLHAMMAQGSFSMWARTTAESVTLPSHTSMLTGVVPVRHGIQWNSDLPLLHPVYPNVPTLFELAKRQGYSTAMAAGKSKFINLEKPGTLDWSYVPDSVKSDDADVLVHAQEMIRDHQPDVLFVHFPSVDGAGHANGWASSPQMTAIAGADACAGGVLDALAAAELLDSTMVLVTSDHGGAGLSHGPDDARSRHIPWIVIGPGVRKNLDLTTYADLQIDTEDTFCTACYVLGIHEPAIKLDGKPIMEIFDQTGQELVRPY